MRIFLEEFSKNYPEQVEKKFYYAGAEGGIVIQRNKKL